MLRSTVLGSTAASGFAVWTAAGMDVLGATPPSEKLQVAIVGVGGRGGANFGGVRREKDVTVTALCDVDEKRAGGQFANAPAAQKYTDFRKMYDRTGKDIDAVVVSTPDHTHFHPSIQALDLGKHLYLEKPMAHKVWECRQLTDHAREKKLATQLGVQRHTIENVHRVVELVQAGAIGAVQECHAWVGGSRGMTGMPSDKPPVPPHLDWDLWLGPAEERPYSPKYAPYGWRFYWDFGTGETGNWGCHVLDIPYWALKLGHATRVEGSGPEPHEEMTPKSMTTRFDFPARGDLPPVSLHWYHTKSGPPILKKHGLPHFGTGVLFVGSEGMLICEFGKRKLFPEKKFKDFQGVARTIPKSPGFYREWVEGCKGGEAATCNFDYSGPMAETVLLGNVAYRAGNFDWNAEKLIAKDNPKAQKLLRDEFRKGWEV